WIVHSERAPEYLADQILHGLQIWVALPLHLEEMEPEFFHIDREKIPHWKEGEVHFRLIAGEALGRQSPVPVYSKLYMIEIYSEIEQELNLGEFLYGESGLYILEGAIETEGNV